MAGLWRSRIHWRRLWARASLAILIGGLAVSLVAAVLWRSSVNTQANQAFRTEAAGVGANVTTALQRLDDLTITARAVVAANPGLTNAQLAAWYRGIGGGRRYPGSVGFGYVQLVPRAGLARFEAEIRRDPVPGLVPLPGPLEITPDGARPSYCFIRLAVSSIATGLVPSPGYDLCAVAGSSMFLAPASSGRVTAISADLLGLGQSLIVSVPVYRGGGTPATYGQRTERFIGWIAGIFDVQSVLGGAVAGDRRLAVTVSRAGMGGVGGSGGGAPTGTEFGHFTPVAEVGKAPGHDEYRLTSLLDADGRWFVTVSKSRSWGFATPDLQALGVLLGGALMSALLAALVLVLGHGKDHALKLVAAKTEELRYQALHDSLTGLPNRALILDRTEQALARVRREGRQIAALYLDLDGFKAVNDTYGHQHGDELLQAVSARLEGALRENDTVGRLGGDEFVVLVEADAFGSPPELVAQRLLDVLSEPFELPGTSAPSVLSASIGVASGPRETAAELLRDADVALYEAKAAGRNCYVVFREVMQTALEDRLALETDLRFALENDQLFLEYQPTFDLASNELVGLEALLRWRHPTRGVIPPGEFIGLAEEMGLIVEIGAWVLHTACAQAASWHRSGYRVELSINVSASQLDDPLLESAVTGALETTGLDARFLILEITESVLMRDPERVVERLRRLKKLGVRIAIDDFGTGYSSLSYLRQFPVDALKLDRSFIAGIAASSQARALIHTLVQLGKTLKLDTVAEGIEDAAQLARLRDEECERGQGFLLGRPLEPALIDSVLERAWRPAPRHRATSDRLPAIRPAHAAE